MERFAEAERQLRRSLSRPSLPCPVAVFLDKPTNYIRRCWQRGLARISLRVNRGAMREALEATLARRFPCFRLRTVSGVQAVVRSENARRVTMSGRRLPEPAGRHLPVVSKRSTSTRRRKTLARTNTAPTHPRARASSRNLRPPVSLRAPRFSVRTVPRYRKRRSMRFRFQAAPRKTTSGRASSHNLASGTRHTLPA